MKQTLQTLTTIMLFVAIFLSCQKESTDPNSKSKTELLTSGTWKRTAFTANPAEDWDGDGKAETDFFVAMQACEKDDITTFKINGDVITDKKTLCSYETTATETFKWKFGNNESTIIIYEDGDEDVFQIVELSSSKLKISNSYKDQDGVTHTYEQTFTH